MSFRIGAPPPPHPTFKRPTGTAAEPQGELFDDLLPCAWRGIVFPVTSVRFTLTQDLVQHKYWGVDAARVEATGRAPLTLEATIPLVNGIVAGKNETWGGESAGGGGGTLYPDVLRELVEAFRDKSSGVFQHPEYGGIVCKPESLEFTHDGDTRDGVIATGRWVETVEPDLNVVDPFQQSSPIKAARLAATDLDASKSDLIALVPDLNVPDTTFEGLVDKVTGVFDTIDSSVSLLKAKPAQLMYHVKNLQASIDRTKNVLVYPMRDQTEKLLWALQGVLHGETKTRFTGGQQVVTPVVAPGRRVLRMQTTQRTSLAEVGFDLSRRGHMNTPDELLELNPDLSARPVIGIGATVRYYE